MSINNGPPNAATSKTDLEIPPAGNSPPSAPSRKLSELPEVEAEAGVAVLTGVSEQDYMTDEEWARQYEYLAQEEAGQEASAQRFFIATEGHEEQQQEQSETETGRLSPLFGNNFVASIKPMTVLRSEYIGNANPVFVQQIDWLIAQGYVGIRRTRPDGDCFYRSLGFAYIERLLHAPDRDLAVAQALSQLEYLKSLAVAQGSADEEMLDDFLVPFNELIGRVVSGQDGRPFTHKELVERFNDMYLSNSIVVTFRAFTSAQIKSDAGQLSDFLFDTDNFDATETMDPTAWCAKYVDPLGKDADHLMIQALTSALELPLRIAYLDGRRVTSTTLSSSSEIAVNFVEFSISGEEQEGLKPVELLYRPGHYDVLATRTEEYDD